MREEREREIFLGGEEIRERQKTPVEAWIAQKVKSLFLKYLQSTYQPSFVLGENLSIFLSPAPRSPRD